VFQLPVSRFINPDICARCEGFPPAGFTCDACGTSGRKANELGLALSKRDRPERTYP